MCTQESRPQSPVARISRRKLLLGGAGTCLLGGSVWAYSASKGDGHTNSPSAREAVDPRSVSSVAVTQPKVAITFDDGPDPSFTPAILDALALYGARATFFMIGSNASAHPDLVKRVVDEGHAIENHTQDHLWLDQQAPSVVRSQITQGSRSIRTAGAEPGSHFRPPRGWTSPTVATITHELGMRSVFWSDCLEAHFSAGVAGAAQEVIDRAEPGSIILCHDGGKLNGPNPQNENRSRTVAAVPAMIKGILDKGLHPVLLSELLQS